MSLTTQPRFYLLKVNKRNAKNTRAVSEMCLNLSADFTDASGVFMGKFEQVNAGSVDKLQNKIYEFILDQNINACSTVHKH